MRLSIAALIIAGVPLPAMAQTTAPWQRTQVGPVTQYTHPTSGATVMAGAGPADANPAAMANLMDKPDGCAGLSRAAVTPILGGRGKMMTTTGGSIHCAVMTGLSASGQPVQVFMMEQPAANAGGRAFAAARFAELMGKAPASAANAAKAPTRPATAASAAPAKAPTVTAPPVNSDAPLRAALAAVPPANRPVAIILRQARSFSGGFSYTIYKPWMLFANGYAADWGCTDWDPRTGAATPASIGSSIRNCEVRRWRKAGALYQFLDDDGWDTDEANQVLTPFPAGLRLDKDLENVSGAGSGAPVTGMVSVNTVFSGRLRMTASGLMQSEWSNSTVVSGANIGGGAGSTNVGMAGRYYLDGYLVAVVDSAGQIKIGFMGGGSDEGEPRYHRIYLNGEQYWPPQ